jgi:hypothetical protein
VSAPEQSVLTVGKIPRARAVKVGGGKTSRARGLSGIIGPMATERKRSPTSTTRHGNGAGGPGWGGPAKGASTTKRKPLTEAGPGRGRYSIAGEQKREQNERHAEEMRELYYEFALDPGQPAMVRINAATHLLNRLDGLPVAKVVTANEDDLSKMTEEERLAEHRETRKSVLAYANCVTDYGRAPLPQKAVFEVYGIRQSDLGREP